jgi:ribosomal protein L7Ae-like RNA K-turn-binding protein
MVRLVISPEGEVAVDLAGGQFGRGAHVHVSPRCLAGAPRGLSRSFRRSIAVDAGALASLVVAAAERRARGLLASAERAQQVEIGAEMAGQAWESGKAHLLVVARDAAAGASTGPVLRAIAAGEAVAWGSKGDLGSLVGKREVAVLGITSVPLATALRTVVRMASSVAENGKSREQRLEGTRAAED